MTDAILKNQAAREEAHCIGCPFDYSDESAMIQNYGCLPTPYEIINMRVEHGKTWACHNAPEKPCIGAIAFLRERGQPYKVIDPELLTEKSPWDQFTGGQNHK